MTTKSSKAIEPAAGYDVDALTRGKMVDSIVLRGDLSGLGPGERARFYIQMCDGLGLNPASQPFAFLRLNGKEILYATRGATDQLAAMHRVTREIIDGPKVVDLGGTKVVFCVAKASMPNGRTETSIATLPFVDPVNVLMKAETKAKRRVTLSILGLGLLDEMEIETIPASSQSPGGGLDLSRANDHRPGEQDAQDAEIEEAPLAPFHSALSGLADATAGARLWHEHRAALNAAHETDRRAAWDALVKRTVKFGGGVGSASAAKNFLKERLAELAPKPAKAADPAPVEASPVDAAPEAPEPAPADEPVAVPFVEQLARCATLDAVATLWLAAREDIGRGTKADQAAAWGAAVERLAVIQHCAPSKALGTLLTKRVCILAGDEPDPNGPKGGHAASDAAPLASVNGHGESASANDAAPQAIVRVVLDADEAEARLVSSAAAWAEHLAQHTGDQWALAIGCAKRRAAMTAAGVYVDRRKATLDALERCTAFVDRGHADVFLLGREHPKAKVPGAAAVIHLRNRDARRHLAAEQATGTDG